MLRQNCEQYLPPEAKVPVKVDPAYALTGAARCAAQYYPQPGTKEPIQPKNLFLEIPGNLWSHAEGQNLLRAMLELAIASHSLKDRTKDAINILKEMLDLDKDDHLVSFMYII